jgi:hypothetical protein
VFCVFSKQNKLLRRREILSGEFFHSFVFLRVDRSHAVLFSAQPVLFTKCQRNSTERLCFILRRGNLLVNSTTNNACYSKFSLHITKDLWFTYNEKVFFFHETRLLSYTSDYQWLKERALHAGVFFVIVSKRSVSNPHFRAVAWRAHAYWLIDLLHRLIHRVSVTVIMLSR